MKMTRAIGASLLATLGIVGMTEGQAHAQATDAVAGFAVNKFEPSDRGSDWFVLDSMDYRGTLRGAFGVVGEYAHRTLATYDRNGDLLAPVVRNQLLLHAGASVVIAERLRLSASLPVGVYLDGKRGVVGGEPFAPPPDEQALGDVRLGANLRLLGDWDDAFRLGLGGRVWLPTGSAKNYMGDGSTRVQPHVNVAGDIGIFTYALHGGFTFRTASQTQFGNGTFGHEAVVYGAAGLRVLDRKLTVGPEVVASTAVSELPDGRNAAFSKVSTPLEGLLGAHYVAGPVRFGVGVGTGLTRGLGAPRVRTLLTLEYQPVVDRAPPDQDGDGILDDVDACVDVKGEPNSADPSKHGCPAPKDRDKDGIPDEVDACADEPGVASAEPNLHGCPADRDRDGVYDQDDACIDDPGVRTSDPKTNGCPPDRDGDGILDRDDACVDAPGIKTDDPKTNGCPDNDRDKDGIANAVDACPDDAGKPDPDPTKNGCPKAFVSGAQIKILEQVKFKTGSAQLAKDAQTDEILKAVVKVLTEHPEIQRVSIEGHTDSTGRAATNKKLSADRAKAVLRWLVSNGIAKERLTSAGFGQEAPIDSNETEAGRKNNRRVEFRILDGSSSPPEAAP